MRGEYEEGEHSSKHTGEYRECEACGSSDGNAVHTDGHLFCHVCRQYTPPPNPVSGTKQEIDMLDDTTKVPSSLDEGFIDGTKAGPINERNIKKETVKHYDVRLKLRNGVVTDHYYPYTTPDGTIVAYKSRVVKSKDFMTHGPITKTGLFGQSKFNKGGRYVPICEGEIDTLAAYQMLGSRFPVVGVKSSSEAYKLCKKQFEWLNSYDTIVLCFDSDEPGQKAAKQVASLFPKKAKLAKFKLGDVGEYLEADKIDEFNNEWWRAEQYKPDDILGGAKTMWKILSQPRAEAAFTYPWDKLNKVTYGMRRGEFTIITAGSGTGKTQVLREISHHVLKTTPSHVGLIYLEETAWETARGLISINLSKPTHLPDTHVTEAELREANNNTWGTDRIFTLGDHWRDNNIDYICDKIKYLNKGLDCELIILDHISFMVSDDNKDERKMLDEIGHKLKAMSIELDIHLCAVAHSRRQSSKPLEEGGTTSLSDLRGTAGLGQLSNIVMGLERNGQAEEEVERNTTLIRVLKNRFSGITGPTSRLYYDQFTGRLTELEETSNEEEKEDV